jgi:hypothetical protein
MIQTMGTKFDEIGQFMEQSKTDNEQKLTSTPETGPGTAEQQPNSGDYTE